MTEGTDKVLEGRVTKLETRVNAISRIQKKIKNQCETILGLDIDGDGKVGGFAAWGLIAIVAICLIAGAGFATTTLWQLYNSDSVHGTVKVVSDDAGTATLTVDAIAASVITPTGAAGAGTAGTGVTATEVAVGSQHTTTLVGAISVVLAEGGTGTNGFGGTKIYDFPEGRILVQGVTVKDVTITVDAALDAADGGDWALGTATAGGTSGLASTEVDICPSTSADPITNVTDNALAASAQFDGTTTAKDIYFNHEIDDGDIAAAATNTVTFTATINWLNLGDY